MTFFSRFRFVWQDWNVFSIQKPIEYSLVFSKFQLCPFKRCLTVIWPESVVIAVYGKTFQYLVIDDPFSFDRKLCSLRKRFCNNSLLINHVLSSFFSFLSFGLSLKHLFSWHICHSCSSFLYLHFLLSFSCKSKISLLLKLISSFFIFF